MYPNGNPAVQAYGATISPSSMVKSEVGGILLLDEATTNIQNAITRILNTTSIARDAADSIFGAGPSTNNKAAQGPPVAPAPRGVGLRVASSALHDALGALESEIDRFRAL